MKTEIIPYAGWENNLCLSNPLVEVIITLDVGPRIISYKNKSGENVLKQFPEQLGKRNEPDWRIRGGHRFWIAPEDPVRSYHVDNKPVVYKMDDYTEEIVIETVQNEPHKIRKSIGLMLADYDSHLTIRHTAKNESPEVIQLATWALTAMQPGGLEIIPLPEMAEHGPNTLLPNRLMTLWPYTDLSDPRIQLGSKFFLLRHAEEYPPTKVGMSHQQKWVAYMSGDSLFIKTFDLIPGAVYPDGGCNFETFADQYMVEIESLSPLNNLAPGESLSHTENWYVFKINDPIEISSEEALEEWLSTYLQKVGI